MPCGEADPDATEHTVDGLTPGKKYKFRVKAVNKEGESEPLESQEPVEAKNPYREPDPPRSLQVCLKINDQILTSTILTIHMYSYIERCSRTVSMLLKLARTSNLKLDKKH